MDFTKKKVEKALHFGRNGEKNDSKGSSRPRPFFFKEFHDTGDKCFIPLGVQVKLLLLWSFLDHLFFI